MISIVTEKNYAGRDIGTKAKNLFIMKNAGIPVPPAMCIDAASFQPQLEGVAEDIAQRLSSTDFSSAQSLEHTCEGIRASVRAALEGFAREGEVEESAARLLGGESFSVRSSSDAEDGASLSFAGQFDTFLNVKPEDIRKRVIDCVSSLYTPGVLKYCHENGTDIAAVKMNVIVQKMIASDISGVIFTSNPQGLLNESVIVAGAGTGDNVVEDKVPTTTYYYNTTDKNYCFDSAKGATKLSCDALERLIDLAERIKKVFGEYLDIEYAILGDSVWILQSRAITTLNCGSLTVLDNSNIVESYPGITLPLSATFALKAYTGVFKGVARRFVNDKTLARYDSALSDMVTCVNGRMYYKISNWYTVIKFLPFSKKIIPVWQEMMGVGEKTYDSSDNAIDIFQRAGVYVKTVKAALSVRREMERLEGVFDEVKQLYDSRFSAEMCNQELRQLYDTIADKLLARWDVTLLNDMYAFCFTGLLKTLLKDCDVQGSANTLISGLGNLESMKPLREMIALSQYASMYVREIEKMQSLTDDEQAERYLSGDSTLCKRLNDYVTLYGDRCLEELKLETVTFKTSPLTFLKKIVEYAHEGDRLKGASHQQSVELSKELLGQCSAVKRAVIKAVWTRAAAGIRNREASRLNRCRIYGMVRGILLKAAENLVSQGVLDSVRDVFYLTLDEAFGAMAGDSEDCKARVAQRKIKYERFAQLPPCSRMVFAGEPYDKSVVARTPEKRGTTQDTLHGTPCSGGKVRAEIAVIERPEDAGDISGKILVTRTTDPGWVFLLTLAGGIIAEKGSLLSHTAIISREIGIPSVVGVRDAVLCLSSGDTVELDGDTGEIKILHHVGKGE